MTAKKKGEVAEGGTPETPTGAGGPAIQAYEIRSTVLEPLEAKLMLASNGSVAWPSDLGAKVPSPAEVKGVAEALNKGLRMKPPAKRHRKESLSKLLRELRPYSGPRKCRPYELFLFAAEKRLMPDKLVRKRNDLDSRFVPNPPRSPHFSTILWTHAGAEPFVEDDQ